MHESGQIDIWYGDLEETPLTELDLHVLLSEAEKTHAATIRRPLVRTRYVAVRAGLRSILARYLDQPPREILIGRTQYGKPFLVEYPDLYFNLSHSGNSCVLALSTSAPLGVDVERVRNRRGFEGLVKKCFTPLEAQYWHALPEQQQLGAFFRFWTAKEAFVKAVGRGIALGLNRVEIDPGSPLRLLSIPGAYGPVEHWAIRQLDLPGPLKISSTVCMKAGHDVRVLINPWTFNWPR